MQNLELHRALVEVLEKRRTFPDEIEGFRRGLSRLRDHDAYPCPLCFLDGDHQPLAALEEVAGFQSILCPSCQATFSIRLR
jgi:hypothetical protein